jgi:hypothetical protein
VKWFGTPWPRPALRAPVCEIDADRVETPVGEECLFCHETIQPTDRGVLIPHMGLVNATIEPAHIECLVRNTSGLEIDTHAWDL